MNKPTEKELHDMAVNEEFIGYEVIDKGTESILPVLKIAFGENVVEVETAVGSIVFENTHNDGNLSNDLYTLRQIDTNLTPNNDGIITNEGIELNPE